MNFLRKEESVQLFVKPPTEMGASSWVSRNSCFHLMGLNGGLVAKLLPLEDA